MLARGDFSNERVTAPVWSPDGTMIAFGVPYGPLGLGMPEHIDIVTTDGYQRWTVSPRTLRHATSLSWSPDSARVVFTGDDVLYIASVNGTAVTPIRTGDVRARYPQWMADDTIVFRGLPPGVRNTGPLFAVSADGSNVRAITERQAFTVSDGRDPLRVSPDRRCVAYLSAGPPDTFSGIADVYVTCIDGRDARITTRDAAGFAYWWLTDGTLGVGATTWPTCPGGVLAVHVDGPERECHP